MKQKTFKVYYKTKIIDVHLSDPKDTTSFTSDEIDYLPYGHITYKENLENIIFKLKWVLENRALIEEKAIAWRDSGLDAYESSDEELAQWTDIQMPAGPHEKPDAYAWYRFSLDEGLCDNVDLYGVRKNLRSKMAADFVSNLEFERKTTIEFEESYPIPGGQWQFEIECETRTLWLNQDRWLYVEFCLEYVTNLLKKLED
jgi:hypothetical protein